MPAQKTLATLLPFDGADCPVAFVFRASWPDEKIIEARLATIAREIDRVGLERAALILVGPALAGAIFTRARFTMPIITGGPELDRAY